MSSKDKKFTIKTPEMGIEGTFVLEGFEEKMGMQMAKLRCIDEDTDIGFIFIPASSILDLEDSTEE